MSSNSKESLMNIAQQLGYSAGYGDNYLQTYGDLPADEVAYFLTTKKEGVKGTIAWSFDNGFFAHWTNSQTHKKVVSPGFQEPSQFLNFISKISELRIN